MEMFSKKFPQLVKTLFSKRSDLHILATIPNRVTGGPLGSLLEELKKNEAAELIEVSKSNRNDVIDKILSILEFE